MSTDMGHSDGLVIMGRGLGLRNILLSFMKIYTDSQTLVIMLNTPARELESLKEDLIMEASSAASADLEILPEMFKIVTNETTPTERITDTSTEAFILRLLRDGNKQAFIKAFSDSAESFMLGAWRLEKAMKVLFLRKVTLWPRFHINVTETFDAAGSVDLREVRIPMTEAMSKIQIAIINCIDLCLQEVKRSSSTTKQIISDISTLRRLLSYLSSYDAVTFLSFLDTIKAANSPGPGAALRPDFQQSPWLMFEAAEVIFTSAKSRVFKTSNLNETNAEVADISIDGIPEGTVPQLEEQPKWKALRDVLIEIEFERAEIVREGQIAGPVVIMVDGDRCCNQIRQIIAGSDLVVVKAENVEESEEPVQQQTSLPSDKGKGLRGRRRVRGGLTFVTEARAPAKTAVPAVPTARSFTSDGVEQLLTRLLKRYFRWKGTMPRVQRNFSRRKNGKAEPPQFSNSAPGRGRGRGAVLGRGQWITGAAPRRRARGGASGLVNGAGSMKSGGGDPTKPKTFAEEAEEVAALRTNKDKVYKSLNPSNPLKVYFMIYDNSIEEQKYLTAIRREKDAFEKLIRDKGMMAIPIDQDGRVDIDPEEQFWRNLDTRIAGGQRIPANEANQVIVDVREFRSSLPSLLHSRRLTLRPCTLEVGDYVLSTHICVERKSIPDLVGSFKSGRLYTQTEAMCLHYMVPILLIEFAQGKAFSLGVESVGPNATGGGTEASELGNKLALLSLKFPKLRIIWSSNPAATAEIFEDLKKEQPEPDIEEAMKIGVENEDTVDSAYSIIPSDMVRALPGVTPQNYRHVMSRVSCMRGFTDLTFDELEKVVGTEGARALQDFTTFDVRNK
ncbi:hypothetical protein HK101_002833 [Irineochytrium annulatum]|nr:hypothetical protein HK101_002833 [Irineochytrium annulatum]